MLAARGIRRSVRTVARGAAVPFPTGQTVSPVQGIQNPEIPPEPEQEGGDDAAARAAQRNRQVEHSLSHRPSARMTARLRAAVAAADLTVPTVTPKAIAGSNPGLDRSFEGLNLFDQRFANNGNQFSIEPPDQGLCVGNGFVLETVNDVLQVYGTGGRALSQVTDLNTFYGSPAQIDRTTGLQGLFVTDPSCYYDPAHKRFFHLALTLDVVPDTGAFTGTNHLDIAVSRTSSPLGGWTTAPPASPSGRPRSPTTATPPGPTAPRTSAAGLRHHRLPGGRRPVPGPGGRGSAGLQRQPHAADLAGRRPAVRGAGHHRQGRRQHQGGQRLLRGRPGRQGHHQAGLCRCGRQQRQLPGDRRAAQRQGGHGLQPVGGNLWFASEWIAQRCTFTSCP